MIYFLGILIGFLNGFFTSGAGQVLVFYLIFIKHLDTHKSRGVSILVLCISSIISILFLVDFKNFDYLKAGIIVVISLIAGFIGTKLMNKINSTVLNLVAGILLVSLSIIKIIS